MRFSDLRWAARHGRASAVAGARRLAASAGTLAAIGAAHAQTPCGTDCLPSQQVQICFDGGRVDNFAAPDDPGTPRPELSAFFCAGNCKDFDNASVNSRFLHTFSGLPCGIVSASLEVKLRAECDIPANDSINLRFAPGPNTFSWSGFIRDLPGAGGSWACPTTSTFTLNLAALPTSSGTLNIIPQMNADHFLDMYVQDDTTVEYARLTLRICPCEGGYRVYTNGYGDHFAASPIDPPAYRQPRLEAIRNDPAFLWRDPDDCTPDRGYGQSFGPLPAGIARSTLTMRMRGCATNPGNDSLAVELLNPGVPLTPYSNTNFYRAFSLPVIMGGAWGTDQSGTFFMNLGTTNVSGGVACGSLLGALSDRYMDVYVQDDTGVDWATLRVWPCPPLTRYFGTAMHGTGQAELGTGSDGELLVSNIGSSGNDGVAIDVHGADGYELTLDPGTTDDMPVGGFVEMRLAGARATGQNGRLRATKHFPDGLWVDSPEEAPGVCARVILSNSFTGEAVETCLPPGGSVMTVGDGVENMRWWRDSAGGLHRAMRLCCVKIKCCDANLVASDGTAIFGDTIEFVSDGGPQIEEMSMNWGNEHGGSFGAAAAVQRAKVVMDRDTGRSKGFRLGQASLDTNPGAVAVTNIGGGGQDGIAIDLDCAGSCTVVVDEPCAGTIEDCLGGMSLTMAATGGADGEPERPLGHTTLSRRPDRFFDIFADFTDLGAAACRVQVIEGDAVVGETVLENPVVVTALTERGITINTSHIEYATDGKRMTYTLKSEEGGRHTPFHNRGVLLGSGDGVRFIALDATVMPDFIERVAFTARGVDELLLRQLVATPPPEGPPCYADFNQDGGIDGADVDAFFASWEAGDPGADVNGDGGVDGGDVQDFFRVWENGGCD